MHISVRSSSRSERASSGRDQMQTGHAADIAERPSLTLCKNSRRYNRTRNFRLYGHAESKKTQKFVFRSALRPNQISCDIKPAVLTRYFAPCLSTSSEFDMPEKIQPTPRRERIAIAGATGRVGSALTSLLASDPVDIVALTRRPDAAQPPNGVTIAAIDFDRPYTLQEALRGADRLFVSHGSSLRQVANEIALIDSAVAVGVRHIVKLSALGPATRLNPFAWHVQIEALSSRWRRLSCGPRHLPTFSSVREVKSPPVPGRAQQARDV